MGIKREMGAGQSWTKLPIVEFIIRDKTDESEMGAREAETSTRKRGRIICIVAGG